MTFFVGNPIVSRSLTTRRDGSEIEVVSATDDGYAMPLAVTIRSALDELSPNRRVRLYVLDGGLSDKNKARLLWSWNDPRLTVEWLRPDMNAVQDLMISEQVNTVTYLRLLMPEILPREVQRAIYLDADMLVRRDLAELWDEPQGDHAVLAVQDIAAPNLDAAIALPRFNDCRRYLAAERPIANYRQLGLPADGLYFNGGMLVCDIARWRRERYSEQMLRCLREHREHVLWWDQYALNVVLASEWRPLDLRWNQGAHLYAYPTAGESPLEKAAFANLRTDPWIVHFCSPSKPWQYFCRHPFTRDWRRALKRTDWHDWRPEKPAQYLAKLWDYHYRPLRNQWKRQVRALKQSLRGERRAA